jgi:DnaA family protein
MSQMLLDLKPEQPPTLDNFVVGANAELLGRLRDLANGQSYESVYLWGPAGCGKSHLLVATVAAAAAHRPAHFFAAADIGSDIVTVPRMLLAIDNAQQLSDDAQIALFRVFNAARLAGLTLILVGDEPPARLRLREDLRTRIGQAMIYEMKTLSDAEKSAALTRHALMRGMKVDAGLIHYLLSRGRRDLHSLMAVLDRL